MAWKSWWKMIFAFAAAVLLAGNCAILSALINTFPGMNYFTILLIEFLVCGMDIC